MNIRSFLGVFSHLEVGLLLVAVAGVEVIAAVVASQQVTDMFIVNLQVTVAMDVVLCCMFYVVVRVVCFML